MPRPLVLAKLAGPSVFSAAFTALVVLALGLVAWSFLRKRSHTGSALVLLAAALLIIGCFAPGTTYEDRHTIAGRFGGSVVLHPALSAATRASVDNGGSAQIERAESPPAVRLACPSGARCNVTLTQAGFFSPDAQGNVVGGNVTLEAHGGPVLLTMTDEICYQVAFTLRLLSGSSCVTCSALDLVVAEGTDGSTSASPTPQPIPDPC